MSAQDTFEWYVTTMKNLSDESIQYIKSLREYLFTLRSEDERQRFVERAIEELRVRGSVKSTHHRVS